MIAITVIALVLSCMICVFIIIYCTKNRKSKKDNYKLIEKNEYYVELVDNFEPENHCTEGLNDASSISTNFGQFGEGVSLQSMGK
eukprot:UN06942